MPLHRERRGARNGGHLHVQMWQYETFIHFGYITVDIIGCVDGKYEHNSTEATCRDFAKISLSVPRSPRTRSPHSLSLSLSRTRVTQFSIPLVDYRTPSRPRVCTRISSSIYLCLFHSLHPATAEPLRSFLVSTSALSSSSCLSLTLH